MKHTNNYLLVSLLVLSIISTAAIINPVVVPPVQAGEPAGDSQMLINCVGLIPKTPSCVGEMQPFEAIVYDANNNGLYDAGETIIVGPSVSPGQALTDEPNVRYRDANNNNFWTSTTPEPIFYDQDGNLLTTNDRVFLIGVPTTLGTLIKDDPAIKFADTDGSGRLNGVVGITARLEKAGGTNIDFSAEDVDAIQVVYTYAPGVLSVMRRTYSPVGAVLPDGTYKSLVRTHCINSGTGSSPLDAINIDEAVGKVSSSHLCSQGPPRDPEVGIGCDPAVTGCFGADGVNKLQNVDVLNTQFMVIAHGAFTISHVVEAPGTPGTKINDIDIDQTTPIPLALVNAFFDNRKPVADVHDAAVIGLAVKESAGPKPYQINVDVQNQGNVPQDISLRGIINPPDLNGVGPFQFQLGIIDPTAIVRVPVAFTPDFGITYTIDVEVFFKDAKVDADPADNTARTTFFLPSPKVGPTAALTAPTKANIKEKVIFDGSASHDNNVPPQDLTYSWMADGAVVPGATMSSLSYTFFTTGLHSVTLTVCNTSMLCDSASHTIQINAVKRDPTAVILGPDKEFVKTKVTFDGSQSRDNSNPVQDIISYEWIVTGPSTGFAINPQPVPSMLSVTFFTPGVYTVTLTVCNQSGLCGSTGHLITINAIKADPTAIINGPDKAFVKEKVGFDSFGSRDNSNPIQSLTYSWTVTGPGPVDVNTLPGEPVFSATFFTPGVYTIVLTVCNESTLCGTTAHDITINAVKADPTAVISCQFTPTGVCPDKVNVKTIVTFDGSGSFDNSNPRQQIVSYSWTATDAAGLPVGSGNQAKFGFVSFVPGVFTISLTVCNESNLCGSASHTLTVNAIKADPTAVIGAPDKVFVKEKVTYDGSGSFDNSNPRQTIVSYTWTDPTGAPLGSGPILSQTYMLPGQYTVVLTVCNESSLCGSTSHTITVNAIKAVPTAVITGPIKVFVKEKVGFDAFGSFDSSNPLQRIISYSWTVTGPAPVEVNTLPGEPVFSATFFVPGVYTVVLTVCNESGLCDDDIHDVTVNAIKRDPTAVIVAPDKVFVKEKVTYDGSGSFDNSNPRQAIVSYTWTSGAVVIGQGPTLSQTYNLPGQYTVSLTVCNESGLCGTSSHTITVNAIKRNPTAVIIAPDKVFVKEKVTYDGRQSFDNSNPLQAIVSYTWTDATGAFLGSGPILSQTYFVPGVYTVTLTVCNESTLCGSSSHTITVNAIKNTPTAVITGPDKAFVKEKVGFDAFGSFDSSNPLQRIISYSWTVTGPAPVDINTPPGEPVFSATFFVPGVYTVVLTVCNESGLCDDDIHDITINAVKAAPTAVISCQFTPTGVCSDKVNVKTIVTFDGSGSFDNSNPRQQIVSYAWTATDAAGIVVGSGNQAKFGFVSFVPGIFTISLTVCNESMLCGSASHTLTVNAIKDFPTAVINGPRKTFVGANIVYDGSKSFDNSNPEQRIVSYRWFDKATGATLSLEPTIKIFFGQQGFFDLSLEVCNESSLCDTENIVITVNPNKQPPTAMLIGPDKAFIKQKVIFDGSGSHDNSDPLQSLTYSWMVDGTALADTGSSISVTFFTTGQHTVTLTVCNASGLCDTTSRTIVINAVKADPTAVISCQTPLGLTPCPDKAFVKEKIFFDGTRSFDNSNPQQAIISYRWSIDNDPNLQFQGPKLSITFSVPGTRTVVLIVCNESNLCNSTTHIITINPVKADPTAVIFAPDKAFVKEKVFYDGGQSRDNSNPVQRIVSYTWTDPTGAPLGSGPLLSQTYMLPGQYTVVLTVCNESGLCNSAMHTITINAVKATPNVTIFGPDKAFVKEKVIFDSLASDKSNPPQNLVSYTWAVDGAIAGTGTSLSYTFFTPGDHTVTLTVCSESMVCGTATHTIRINAIKDFPTAIIKGPDKAFVKEKVLLDGRQSFDNSNPVQSLTYSWTLAGGEVGSESTLSITFSLPGTYTVTLTVCNESQLCNSASHTITINAVKADPTAVIIGPAKVTEGDTVTYRSGSRDNSNPQQQIISYQWVNKNTGQVLSDASTVTITFPVTDVKSQMVLSLTVCNESGFCNRTQITIQINVRKLPLVLTSFTVCTVIGDPVCNRPPVKSTGQTDLFITETQNYTATWTGGTGPFTCTFTFGDSSSATVTTSGQSCSASHVYTTTGTRTASVRVVGQNPGDDKSADKVVQLNPEPRYFHGKLSWKHHLVSPATQPFSGKATNPSTKTVLVRIDLVVDMPNGMQDFCKDEAVVDNCSPRSFTLGPGGSNTNMAFTYTPGDGLGKYCFDATLSYGIDQNGNGLLEQTEVLGTDNVKSGCFNYV
jgi:PKD repeat protein